MKLPRKTRLAALLVLIGFSTAACVSIYRRVQVQAVNPQNDVSVVSPVKAHLKDGSTVTFTKGVRITGGIVRGDGFMTDLTLTQGQPVSEIPLDSVLAMESFETHVNTGR